ncbi:MAG: restriction endonuclease subunit S [Caldisericum sp.]|uniref:restriction endonuclease subunit S n=1 Tax=Caldisericum sp. TaxID=2499687 RepID=UPI003D108802
MKFLWETEFKETEIGEIPKDWEEKEIKKIGEIGGGTTPSTKVKDFWNGDIPWITPKDLSTWGYRFIQHGERNITERAVKENSLRIYPTGTILLTSRAPIGYVAITKNPVATNQGFKNIIPTNMHSEYLYYLLISLVEYLRDISGGSTFGELTKEILKSVKIPYPLLPEQSRIATVLSWFDDLIENKKKQNEILEKTAMAIFKNWFIDFEPFKDQEFVYNEDLGKEIPRRWEVNRLAEVAEFINGLSYKGSEKFYEHSIESYVFITLNNIREGGGFKTEYTWIRSDRLKEKHFVKEYDVIFANTEQTKTGRLLATPAFVVFPDGYNRNKGVYSHHITKISPKKEHFKIFLYLIFRVHQKDIAQTYHTGTGVWGFDLKNFKENFLIPIPPSSILQRFHSLAEPLFQKIILNQKQIMTLKKIRDTLLPLLVFGKLRVEEL